MVKTIVSVLIAALLLAGAAVFEYFFVKDQFGVFKDALTALEEKTRENSATGQDAKSVQAMWDAKKKRLHIVIPHNDISYIDYWMGEAVSYIETKNYDGALSKIEVLLTICTQLPNAYRITFENVF